MAIGSDFDLERHWKKMALVWFVGFCAAIAWGGLVSDLGMLKGVIVGVPFGFLMIAIGGLLQLYEKHEN